MHAAPAAPGGWVQVYKALYDDVQVVAVKLLPGINEPTQLEAVLREVGRRADGRVGRQAAGSRVPSLGPVRPLYSPEWGTSSTPRGLS